MRAKRMLTPFPPSFVLLQLSPPVNVPEASMEHVKMGFTRRPLCHGVLYLYTQCLTAHPSSLLSPCSTCRDRRLEITSLVFPLKNPPESYTLVTKTQCQFCHCILFINKLCDRNCRNIHLLKGCGWNQWCVGGRYLYIFL